MPVAEISIDAFGEDLVGRVHQFVTDWKKNARCDPEGWPLELELVEWDEEWDAWFDDPPA